MNRVAGGFASQSGSVCRIKYPLPGAEGTGRHQAEHGASAFKSGTAAEAGSGGIEGPATDQR